MAPPKKKSGKAKPGKGPGKKPNPQVGVPLGCHSSCGGLSPGATHVGVASFHHQSCMQLRRKTPAKAVAGICGAHVQVSVVVADFHPCSSGGCSWVRASAPDNCPLHAISIMACSFLLHLFFKMHPQRTYALQSPAAICIAALAVLPSHRQQWPVCCTASAASTLTLLTQSHCLCTASALPSLCRRRSQSRMWVCSTLRSVSVQCGPCGSSAAMQIAWSC